MALRAMVSGPQQLVQRLPHVVQNGRMRFGLGVDAVGLKVRQGVRLVGHASEQKGREGGARLPGDAGVDAGKAPGVVHAVVGNN